MYDVFPLFFGNKPGSEPVFLLKELEYHKEEGHNPNCDVLIVTISLHGHNHILLTSRAACQPVHRMMPASVQSARP